MRLKILNRLFLILSIGFLLLLNFFSLASNEQIQQEENSILIYSFKRLASFSLVIIFLVSTVTILYALFKVDTEKIISLIKVNFKWLFFSSVLFIVVRAFLICY